MPGSVVPADRAALLTLSRRRMLSMVTAAPFAWVLAGCTGDPEPDPTTTAPPSTGPAPSGPASPSVPPDPDLARIAMIAESAARLGTSYGATMLAHPTLAAELTPLAEHHAAHLAELTDDTPSYHSSPAPAEPAPTDPAAARAALAAAESAAVGRAAGAASAARSGETARLLAAIAGCRAAHALLLAGAADAGRVWSGLVGGDGRLVAPSLLGSTVPTADPTVSPSATTELSEPELTALQAALAGEHAVVWAYGVLGPRLLDDVTDRARQLLVEHRQDRDRLRSQLVGAGATPVAAEPAYALPVEPVDPPSAAALAALVEERLTAVYGDLAAAASRPTLRTYAVQRVVTSARRIALWSGAVTAFPGMPEQDSTPSPS